MDYEKRIVQQSVGMSLGMIGELSQYARESGHSLSRVVRNAVDLYLKILVPTLSGRVEITGKSLADITETAVGQYIAVVGDGGRTMSNGMDMNNVPPIVAP